MLDAVIAGLLAAAAVLAVLGGIELRRARRRRVATRDAAREALLHALAQRQSRERDELRVRRVAVLDDYRRRAQRRDGAA